MILVAAEDLEILRSAIQRTCLDSLAAALGTSEASLMRRVMDLNAKGLVDVERATHTTYVLTEEGNRYVSEGLPELRALRLFTCIGGECTAEVDSIRRAFREGAEVVLANLARLGLRPHRGIIRVDAGTYESAVRAAEERQRFLARPDSAPPAILQEFVKRGLVKRVERTVICIRSALSEDQLDALAREGRVHVPRIGEVAAVAGVVTALTSQMIRDGTWRGKRLKPFDLKMEYPTLDVATPHFFYEFLDYIREAMVGLGFEEVRGPLVEVEFWNFDALFQAQDHPAREIHDTFFVDVPLGEPPDIPGDVMARVRETHENGWVTGSVGWGYAWSEERARRPILRTQTTAVTVRTLYERGDGEYRVFTIGKVFRPEKIDPRHMVEFHQMDGIVVGRDLTFRNMLGVLETIARRLGMERVMFKPAYFPFTSPSVESYAYHPRLGWVEFGGAGIFRPEVVMPMGIRDSKVLAFGWGVDRIAMLLLGLDDIRDLFTHSIGEIRRLHGVMARALLPRGANR